MWAIPGIRKAYEDFKVKETVSHVDTFITGFRSHYLIRSEFPEDATTNLIHPRFTWCLPSSYFTRMLQNTRYYLNITPYEGSYYDIDSWIASGSKNFHITLYTDVPDKWYTRLRKKYGYVTKRSTYVTVEDF